MQTLPQDMIPLLQCFAPVFSRHVFEHVKRLVAGAILTPGQRTITNILRTVGLDQDAHFQTYHRVLNRAVWSSLKASKVLLGLLIRALVPEGEVVLPLDETLERRRGKKIAAKGIYHDAVRSSKSHFAKASGLRWLVMAVSVKVPWAGRVWALPFLSVLAPSERFHQERGVRHKTLTDTAMQMITQVRRWLPDRKLILVGDEGYARLRLLERCQRLRVVGVTRLRLDAALYDLPKPKAPGKRGPQPKKGERQPKLADRLNDPLTEWRRATVSNWYGEGERTVEIATGVSVWYRPGEAAVSLRWVLIRSTKDDPKPFKAQALLCTDPEATPEQVLAWFIQRWPLEVTFEESRAHLGVETLRNWNDLSVQRSTPALLGLYSLVTLWADALPKRSVRRSAWYPKEQPTFSDALAGVRRSLWRQSLYEQYLQTVLQEPESNSSRSAPERDRQVFLHTVVSRLTETLCYAH